MDTPFDTSFLVERPNTEDSYREWIRQHPRGYVINAWREPTGKKNNAMMWHQADCDHIDPKYASAKPPFVYVSGHRLKACSAHPAALAMWAKDQTEPLTYCSDCYSAWQKEQPSVS